MLPGEVAQGSLRLESLARGMRVFGIVSDAVTVLAVEALGDDAVTVTYRRDNGAVDEHLLFRSDEIRLRVEATTSRWTFDGDGADFRLGAEALRIRMAGLHDPMLAVTTSDVRPLPHQIRAVYGELLPRTPLRFVLADDPGAGKTVMAGLYAKELMLRGDLARLLIVAPGGLVEQWQDELSSKFGIQAEVLSRDMVTSAPDSNPFAGHPLLIARMDQLARDEDLQVHLATTNWDLVVVDEAHRMSARWWGGELTMTQRYRLGKVLSGATRHLLLMTATPHAGDEASFQLFLALLDPDRFEGQYRHGVHSQDTTGLMRRMLKEDLLTFEGTPLFPERIAETVPYELSDGEYELYEAVTEYVRTEMNRADALPDSPRTRTVGFALTVLQRRLASSTHAILRSLQRRLERLSRRRLDLADPRRQELAADALQNVMWSDRLRGLEDDEIPSDEAEALEEAVADSATAARTLAELDIEIGLLRDLVALATRVRDVGEDRKWAELRSLLLDQDLLQDESGAPRKLIVFTEHRDTLDYLTGQIRNVLGRDDAVVEIHGGTRREDRRAVRERFTTDRTCQVLVATDAAGEGLNLQAAYLMVNYDLPWNPNRLEQRFGRIHRIGQKHVCRLWNLVAEQTREGQVFARLLLKMEEQRRAYGGRLFDVLGESFSGTPLRSLLIDAIRYGDDPAKFAELDRVIDAEVSDGLEELMQERALARESLQPLEVERIRREMEEAAARRLQPHYVELFFMEAFARCGGRLSKRERGRFEISHVPVMLRQRQPVGARVPISQRYQRVTFEPSLVDGTVPAVLLAPGHPLMDAALEATLESCREALHSGATLIDPGDAGTTPRLIIGLTIEIVDGTDTVVSKRFAFVTLLPDGEVADAGPAPYLEMHPLTVAGRPVADAVLRQAWLSGGVDALASRWAAGSAQPAHLAQVRERVLPAVSRTRAAVRQRLVQQVNHLDNEAARVREEKASGRPSRSAMRVNPDRSEARARELEERLAARMVRLDAEELLRAKPPTVVGAALVIPAGMLPVEPAPTHARETAAVERRAVDAALAAERALGRVPVEMHHNNPGFDIRSVDAAGKTLFLEVKGRIADADDFFVTYNEVLFGKNAADQYRLVLVKVSPDGPEHDEIRYVTDPFRSTELGSFAATGVRGDLNAMWNQGSPPA